MDTSTIALIAGVVGGVVVVGQTIVTHGIPALIAAFKTDEGKVETKLVAAVSEATAALASHRAKYGSIFKQAVASATVVGKTSSALPASIIPTTPAVVSPGIVASLVQDAERVI